MARAPLVRLTVVAVIACGVSVSRFDGDLRAEDERAGVPLKLRMLVAEDRRPTSAGTLAPLFEGLTSLSEVQVMAVRALGRLERVDLVPRIATLLRASAPAVRAEAANALGQAVARGDAASVVDLLRARIPMEQDPTVRGTLARTIGRLPYRTPVEIAAALQVLLSMLSMPGVPTERPAGVATASASAPLGVPVLLGVTHGLESLARRSHDVQPDTIQPAWDAARARLAALVRYGLDAEGVELPGREREDARRVRRLAMTALFSVGGAQEELITAAAADPDPQVRRLALRGLERPGLEPRALEPWAVDLLARALADLDPRVRIEALRRLAEAGGRVACVAAKQAVIDADTHVALVGLDISGRRCEADVEGVQLLDEMAVPPEFDAVYSDEAWHRSAHALVALARLMPDRTRARLAPFASHPLWHVRLYTARAAGLAGATAILETLARDANDNVAEAALTELARRVGRRADPHLIAALARMDGQIVRTAARALAGTQRHQEVTQALMVSLARQTVELRDTSRDVRIALMERLEETGAKQPRVRDELTAYLGDFDPVVAQKAAAILFAWGDTNVSIQPRLLPPPRVPSLELLARLRRTTAVVSMVRGGSFRMRLFADEAPTNVARFARLASSGYFSGLTFHRVEPTFVIQGGSPNANEYAGAGAYTRDEVGLRSHLRGTVGISTRGRDTGDGQIFVNLVDNVRLDHNYTIIGEIIDGMDVVDGILEGDAIRRIALRVR